MKDTFGQTDDEQEDESENEEETEVQSQGSQSEVQFNHARSREREMLRNDSGRSTAPNDWRFSKPLTSGNETRHRPESPLLPEDEIKSIDEEMRDRIKDLHQMMLQQGLTSSSEFLKQCFDEQGRPRQFAASGKKPGKRNRISRDEQVNLNHNATNKTNVMPCTNQSEATIYDKALQKRDSSSSDEVMEFSDESLENNESILFVDRNRMNQYDGIGKADTSRGDVRARPTQVLPGNPELTPEERAEKIIQEGELVKAKIFPPKGEVFNHSILQHNNVPLNLTQSPEILQQSAIPFELVAKVDYDYLIIGGHIDENMRQKIVKGEYIDFSKLIPRDKMLTDDDHRLELVVRNGRTF